MRIANRKLSTITPYDRNPRHNADAVDAVAKSIQQYGFRQPIVVDEHGVIIVGHTRYEAAKAIGLETVPVHVAAGMSEADSRAYRIADNKTGERATWDDELLTLELRGLEQSGADMGSLGFTEDKLDAMLGEDDANRDGFRTLTERFVVPPFTVLDARQGYWQDRKREWLAIGIQSELGRSDELLTTKTPRSLYAQIQSTSIFDPVLCEVSYRWLCPPGGSVLDPFAGGSVRGIVASRLGRRYVGIELRPEQIEANREQADRICGEVMPEWIEGDAADVAALAGETDFVFTCPPYADLEKYSDDPRDLSAMKPDEFEAAYRQVIVDSCSLLRDDRFACFVVGDLRDKRGRLRGLPAMTVDAFEAAGLTYYNDAVLITALGALFLRAGAGFEKSRKLCRGHQYVYVFVKGDPRAATEAVGPVDVAEEEDAQ